MKQEKDLLFDRKEWYIANRTPQYCELIQDVIDRIDNLKDYDIWEEIDSTIIYYYQEWIIAKEHTNSPLDLNFYDCMDTFAIDCEDAIYQILTNGDKK